MNARRCLILGLSALIGAPSVFASAMPVTSFYCMANAQAPRNYYLTGIFPAGADRRDVISAWRLYLQRQGINPGPSPSCQTGDPATLKQSADITRQAAAANPRGPRLVELDWRFAAGDVPPGATGASAVSGGGAVGAGVAGSAGIGAPAGGGGAAAAGSAAGAAAAGAGVAAATGASSGAGTAPSASAGGAPAGSGTSAFGSAAGAAAAGAGVAAAPGASAGGAPAGGSAGAGGGGVAAFGSAAGAAAAGAGAAAAPGASAGGAPAGGSAAAEGGGAAAAGSAAGAAAAGAGTARSASAGGAPAGGGAAGFGSIAGAAAGAGAGAMSEQTGRAFYYCMASSADGAYNYFTQVRVLEADVRDVQGAWRRYLSVGRTPGVVETRGPFNCESGPGTAMQNNHDLYRARAEERVRAFGKAPHAVVDVDWRFPPG